MTSRYEETLVVDTRQALAALQRLESTAKDALTVDVDIDPTAAQALADQLDTANRHSLDLDRNSRDIEQSLRQAEQAASRLTSEVSAAELAAGRSDADFRDIAQSLGLAEDQARDMAREVLEAQVAATKLEENIRDVARQMGLTGDEANRFERNMRDAARAQSSVTTGSAALAGSTATLTSRMGALRGVLGAVAGAAGLAAVGRGLSAAISASSDLAESTSKAQVVFGSALGAVQQQLGDTATSVLLSNAAALEATATFGNLFVAIGLSQQEAANLSVPIVKLAADLASFNNISVEEALQKLQSGLVGQVEPLRSVGVALSETLVQEKALELGLVGVNGELTEAAKVQARYALILERTGTAQGDVARTLEGFANTGRRARAEVGDFGAELGDVLVPAAQAFQALIPDMIEGLRQLVPSFAASADSAAAFFNELDRGGQQGSFRGIIQGIGAGIGLTADAFAAFGDIGSAIFDTLGGDIEAAGRQTDQLGQRISRTSQRIGGQGLARDLDAGVDRLTAFGNALSFVARDSENVEVLTDSFRAFAIQANLTQDELAGVTQFLIDNAVQAGLSAAEIEALRLQLQILNNTMSQELSTEAERLAAAFQRTGESATNAAPRFATMVAAVNEAGEAIPTLASAVADAGEKIGDNLDPFSKAAESVKVSGKQFLQNLRDQVTATAKFEADVARLVAAGFTRVASELLEQGPAAAQAAADLVANTTRAAEAEQLLAGVGTEAAQRVGNELSTELRSTGLTQQAREGFISLADQFDSPQVAGAFVAAGRGSAQSVGAGFGPQMFIEGELGGGEFSDGLLAGIRGLSAGEIAASVTDVLVSSVSLANAHQAGVATGKAFEDGVKRGLEITSPSRVMQRLAAQAVGDFLSAAQQRLAGGLDVSVPVTGGIESALSAADLASSITQRLVSSSSLAQARTAGEEIAGALEGGIRGGLEMSSPSRLMQRIAAQAVADFLAATQSSLSGGLNITLPVSGGLTGSLGAVGATAAAGLNLTQNFNGLEVSRDAAKGAQIAGTIISMLGLVRGPGTGARL